MDTTSKTKKLFNQKRNEDYRKLALNTHRLETRGVSLNRDWSTPLMRHLESQDDELILRRKHLIENIRSI